jgi:hypothetical protein
MVQVKGTLIAAKRQYVLQHHGPDALRKVLDQLKDREAAKRLESVVLKSAWYPFDLWIDLTQTIDKVVGRGDGGLLRPMAKQTADDDLSSVYKVYFKQMQPMHVFDQAAQLWSAYYNSGSLQITKLGPSSVEMEIVGFGSPHWVHCESALGWAERSVQLAGTKDVQAEHMECRGRGGSRCRMRVTWKQ